MTPLKVLCLAVGFGLFMSLPARAQISPLPSLVRVVSTSEVVTVATGGLNNLSGRQMTKFLNQIEKVREKIQVDWSSPKGWKGGTEVRLEYRTADSSTAQAVYEHNEHSKPGLHVASFVLPGDSPLSAWRVRLIQGNRLLDEKSSGTWK